jgi:hypothetical protein
MTDDEKKKEIARRAAVIASKFGKHSAAFPKMTLQEVKNDVEWIIEEV